MSIGFCKEHPYVFFNTNVENRIESVQILDEEYNICYKLEMAWN